MTKENEGIFIKLLLKLGMIEKIKKDNAINDNNEMEYNKSLMVKLHNEVWSLGNFDMLQEIISSKYIGHLPMGKLEGFEGLKDAVATIRDAFPDWNHSIEDIIMSDDKIVTRISSSGTNQGKILNFEPTGKKIQLEEIAIFRISGRKIVEQWSSMDLYGLCRQLGIDMFPQDK